MPRKLSDYAGVLLDLDGTLVKHAAAMPGAVELVRHLKSLGVPTLVVTNSTNGPSRVGERLEHAGLDVDPRLILTAAQAAMDDLVVEFGKPRVFNLGQGDMDDVIRQLGTLVDVDGDQACDAVLVGTPPNARATPDRQRHAVRLLRHGARLVGVCADRLYPSRHGLEIGCGAFCQMLAFAAGTRATFNGKPEKAFFLDACRLINADPTECLMIGDNLDADILGAKAVGMRAGLVLGGVSTRADAQQQPRELRPAFVADDLRAVLDVFG
ncbi:MAG: HAD-IIA family hydrolase [Planctomycetota bacterium]